MTSSRYRRERIRRSLTQAQLAELLDVSRVTIANRERGAPGYPITREAWLAIQSLPTARLTPPCR